MQLNQFINKTMKMTSYYQPIIILACAKNNGKASLTQKANLSLDLGLDNKSSSEIIAKLKIHPKTVLASHNVAKLESNEYTLNLSFDNDTVSLCNDKIASYKKQRGL